MNSKLTVGTAYTAAMTEAASRVLSAAAVTSESPFDLVGYSLGAGVAAFIAAEHPEVVRSLVLISGFAYGGDVWMKLQFNLWLDLLRTDRIALTRLLLLTGLSRDFVSNMDEDTMAAAIHAFATSSDWESIQRAIRLDLNVDLRDHIRRIAAPTLLITAKHDRIVPGFYSQQLARLAVGVQRAEIDSGHLSFLEQPAPLATTISSFVDSLAARNPAVIESVLRPAALAQKCRNGVRAYFRHRPTKVELGRCELLSIVSSDSITDLSTASRLLLPFCEPGFSFHESKIRSLRINKFQFKEV